MTGRYLKSLEIFKRVLVEEEAKMAGTRNKSLSALVEWSETSGAMNEVKADLIIGMIVIHYGRLS